MCFNLGVNSRLAVSFNQNDCQVTFIYKQEAIRLQRERLIQAIIQVESNGNTLAYNHKEQSAGCMQIRPIMVRHINRISGSKYTLADRYDPVKSVAMFDSLMLKRNPRYNIDTACNLWNAGQLVADIPKYKSKIYNQL